ncbi:MAG TPA: GNAT family N-acetyltransferase [Candidatus Fimimorpha excrementavium]|nr:GNAT family N-acetyltransferase [Candidatus Fimimorpha excrementavium]
MSEVTFRYAEEKDTGLVLEFIRGIAAYEKLLDEVVATEESLHEWMFEKKLVEVIFAEAEGDTVGFALFFQNFSTFVGRAGLYLEDIFVKPQYRKKGYGKAIFRKLAQIAVERGCQRFEWVCLDWNQPSIDFYRSMGAVPMEEWTIYRLSGDAIRKAAEIK